MKKQITHSKKANKAKWVRIIALVLAALMVGGMVFATVVSLG